MRLISKHSVLLVLLFSSAESYAFRSQDMSGDDAGAVVVYKFDEVGGDTVFDSSGVGAPLNLKMSNAGNLPTADGTVIRTNALLQSGYLLMNPKPNGAPDNADLGYQSAQRHRTYMVSQDPATKLAQCTTGLTVQAFVRPWFPFQGSDSGNMIVGLSNSEGQPSLKAPNFALYQSGQKDSASAMMSVRTGNNASSQTSVPGAFSSLRQDENPGKLTEIIATLESNGIMTVYVNRIARSSLMGITPVFLPTAKLVIGNELVPLSLDSKGNTDISQQKNWSGEIYHVAIYCRGFSRTEILGELASSKIRQEVVRPMMRASISNQRVEARRMVERLTGTVVPIDHPMVLRVEDRLLHEDRTGAAKIITGDLASGEVGHPEFLNTVVKQMAMKMSNREETIRAPLNDFAASFIGVTRDERSAKELLTADFFYMANPAKAKVRSDMFRDMLISNNHYEDLEKGQWDLGKVLMRVPGPEVPAGYPQGQQIATDVTGSMSPNPDPAGVLTSRAFMSAHAIAGTNRRLVEYTFREFMCVPMSEMADTSASPARIGRDIDRLPGGDAVKFETSCKGCHTVMDGFRGAFARFDFADVTVNGMTYNFVRNTQINRSGSFGFNPKDTDSNFVVRKMTHNETVFPDGYQITDESFINNAVGVANKTLFGWSGANSRGGIGINQFGRMIADSHRFSQCMAKRVFEAVCQPGVVTQSKVTPLIDGFAMRFQETGYKLRTLFQDVAASPSCAALMGR